MSSEYFVYINYKGIPDPPFNLSIVALSWGSAELTWKAGFDGGNSQTFVISVYSDTGDYHEVIANTTEGNVTGELLLYFIEVLRHLL